jgi:hypothetical protein
MMESRMASCGSGILPLLYLTRSRLSGFQMSENRTILTA